MKHTINAMTKRANTIVASFFVNSRGAPVQSSASGLFRSLIHQISQRIPDFLRKITSLYIQKCATQGEHGKRWEWHKNELRDFFVSHIFKAAKTYTIRIYMDALDECGKETADDLLETFQTLINRLSICISCRHYPLIPFEDRLEIRVENNNAQDIQTHLDSQIHPLIKPKDFADLLRDQIATKASGNFQWVILITKMVCDWHKRRKSPKFIQNRIASTPAKLSRLYEELIAGIVEESEKLQSFKLMQWICFSFEPLSLRELRFAMIVDANSSCQSIRECQDSEEYLDSDDYMEIALCDLSSGLAKVVKNESYQAVQLIHQTVHDFFLDKGLQMLQSSQEKKMLSATALIGRSQLRLSMSCINYLAMKEVQEFIMKDVEEEKSMREKHDHDIKDIRKFTDADEFREFYANEQLQDFLAMTEAEADSVERTQDNIMKEARDDPVEKEQDDAMRQTQNDAVEEK